MLKKLVNHTENKVALKKAIKEKARIVLTKMRSGVVKMTHIQQLKFFAILYEMIDKNIQRTKREIFYMAVTVFKTQQTVNIIAKNFNIDVGSYVTASLKSLFYGPIKFHCSTINQSNNDIPCLIPDIKKVLKIELNTDTILVLEKDAAFSFITQNNPRKDILYLCGKGYPCHNLSNLLKILCRNVYVQIYGMFDFDPYGIHIATVYQRSCPLKRIGILSSDIIKRNIQSDIKLAERDKKYLSKLMSFINPVESKNTDTELKSDLFFMKGSGTKVEMEGLIENNSRFYEEYINEKIDIRNTQFMATFDLE